MAITNFTPIIFTNEEDGGRTPINATNLNEMQRVLDTLNQAGLTQEEIVDLIKSNSASKSYVNEYQQPWNIEKNVGRISLNYPPEFTCTADTALGNTVNYKWQVLEAINSGDLYLDFKIAGFHGSSSYHYSSFVDKVTINIYVNDKLINTYYYERGQNSSNVEINEQDNRSNISTFIENISKGDKIYMNISVTARQSAAGHAGCGVGISIKNIALRANIDTPYKYFDLPDLIREL